MTKSDLAIFLENLNMWDRLDTSPKGPPIIKKEDNIDRIIDEMFERFCDLELDQVPTFVGNC